MIDSLKDHAQFEFQHFIPVSCWPFGLGWCKWRQGRYRNFRFPTSSPKSSFGAVLDVICVRSDTSGSSELIALSTILEGNSVHASTCLNSKRQLNKKQSLKKDPQVTNSLYVKWKLPPRPTWAVDGWKKTFNIIIRFCNQKKYGNACHPPESAI